MPPSSGSSAIAAEQLRALRERFRAATAKTVAMFRALAADVAAAPEPRVTLETLRRELHRVRGTAGSYGFLAASRLAGEMEARVRAWEREPRRDRGAWASDVAHFADALERSLGSGEEGVSRLTTSRPR